MKGGVVGCLGFLYLMAALFFAAAWFGVPIGENNHGLNVLFRRNLVFTTGKEIRFERMGTSSHPGSRPIVEIDYRNARFRFSGGGSDSHSFVEGDEVPVAYPAGHPEEAYIRTFRQMYLLPTLMIVFALPFFALALWGTLTNLPRRDATS
jgi:hypothetical protein